VQKRVGRTGTMSRMAKDVIMREIGPEQGEGIAHAIWKKKTTLDRGKRRQQSRNILIDKGYYHI
jgi:hypothetical protein